MKHSELVIYEMPRIAEYISAGWLQDVMAKYVARRVSRKMRRYRERVHRRKAALTPKPKEEK